MRAGDIVTWVSQSRGCATKKTGEIIAEISAGENAMQYVPEDAKPCHIKFKPVSMYDRVLISVQRGKNREIYYYYCPTKSMLEKQVCQD